MKCKICGHRTNTLPAMRRHYSKAHPGACKRKKVRKLKGGTLTVPEKGGVMVLRPGQPMVTEPIVICPRCGQSIRVSRM